MKNLKIKKEKENSYFPEGFISIKKDFMKKKRNIENKFSF